MLNVLVQKIDYMLVRRTRVGSRRCVVCRLNKDDRREVVLATSLLFHYVSSKKENLMRGIISFGSWFQTNMKGRK